MHNSMKPNQLLWMAGIHFVLMFFLMYAMIDRLENLVPSFNQVYMAGLMTAPMVALEVLLMGSMYANQRLMRWLLAGSLVLFVTCFALIRMQAAVDDRELLRSMIPHHAGAILMCEQAKLDDPRVIELCDGILAAQEREISLMKSLLEEVK